MSEVVTDSELPLLCKQYLFSKKCSSETILKVLSLNSRCIDEGELSSLLFLDILLICQIPQLNPSELVSNSALLAFWPKQQSPIVTLLTSHHITFFENRNCHPLHCMYPEYPTKTSLRSEFDHPTFGYLFIGSHHTLCKPCLHFISHLTLFHSSASHRVAWNHLHAVESI